MEYSSDYNVVYISVCVYNGLRGTYWLTRQCCLMYVPAAQAQWVSSTLPPVHSLTLSVSRSFSQFSVYSGRGSDRRPAAWWPRGRRRRRQVVLVAWLSHSLWVLAAATRVCSRLYASFSLFIVATFFVPRNSFTIFWERLSGGSNFNSFYQCSTVHNRI